MKKYMCIVLSAIMMMSVAVYAEGEEEPTMSVEVITNQAEIEEIQEPSETVLPLEEENNTNEMEEEKEEEIDSYGLNPPTGDTWSADENMINGRADFNTVIVDGDLYVIGGLSSSGHIHTIEKLNSDTNIWETVTSIPDEVIGFSVVNINSDIYIIGGYSNGIYLNDIRIYNTQTGLWRIGKPMIERRDSAAVLYTDNKIYVFGGRNAKGIENSYEYYDIYDDTWHKVTSGYDESLIRIGAKGKYINGYVCIYGGLNQQFQYMGVNLYLASDMTDMIQMTSKGKEYVSLAWGRDKALVFTANTADAATYSIEEMVVNEENQDIRAVKIADYPINAKYVHNVIYNGRLYCMGGYVSTPKTYNNEVYQYSVNFGDFVTGDGIINGVVTADGNSITMNVEAGKNYYLMINVNNMSSFNGYTFTIEYPEDSFTVMDACAFTEKKDKDIGLIVGSDIRLVEKAVNGLSFTCSETIPTGKIISETVNTVLLRAESSGQRTITYRMTK